MPFTRLFDTFKAQTASMPQKPSVSVDDSMIPKTTPPTNEPPKRRWSHVTYLDAGTLHGEDDNLIVGL
ncbi:hypothetical protein ACI3LY_001935 [Candidozyma auris]|uniref:Uncharacterized protein n=1 Tax=Candidozyma auris TaxID=498019 RepID=A0A2H0ZK66_CANAR|nr:hypothetical protein B9J08_002624 [[Candida] auris]